MARREEIVSEYKETVVAITDNNQSGKLHNAAALNGLANAVDGNHSLFEFANDFFSSGQS